MTNTPTAINIAEKMARIDKHWAPKIIAEINDHQFKLVKFQGEFVWHEHDHTDEVFIVIEGGMRIQFRGDEVALSEGEMIAIPAGLEHRPVADDECQAMLLERASTINTGNEGGGLTAPNDDWI